MATFARNTGTHFRYDSDKGTWDAKMRVKVVAGNAVKFKEFVTEVATLLELLAWLSDILAGLAAQPDTTVLGAPDVAAIKAKLLEV